MLHHQTSQILSLINKPRSWGCLSRTVNNQKALLVPAGQRMIRNDTHRPTVLHWPSIQCIKKENRIARPTQIPLPHIINLSRFLGFSNILLGEPPHVLFPVPKRSVKVILGSLCHQWKTSQTLPIQLKLFRILASCEILSCWIGMDRQRSRVPVFYSTVLLNFNPVCKLESAKHLHWSTRISFPTY